MNFLRSFKGYVCKENWELFAISPILYTTIATMVKGKQSAKKTEKLEKPQQSKVESPIELDKSNNILIKILAKPGAKQNCITDISTEGVGVQINAPPSEGEANMELIKYMCQVLQLRKTNIVLDKGFKSRQKTLKILCDTITKEQVEEKLRNEMQST